MDAANPMNIVFIGASKFSLRCLETIKDLSEIDVVGVITAQPTFRISYSPTGVTNVLYADLTDLANDYDIPFAVLKHSMNDQVLIDEATSWRPDAFIVAGWYHMIPRRWRDLAPAYGLHASLLPDYSGGAPLVWAMINGEPKTGISLFQMDDGVDSGPIVGQVQETIYADDTIGTLYNRIEARGLELLTMYLPKLAAGTAKLIVQDESKRRILPQRGPEDGIIDWRLSAKGIYDFVRAQTRPYPGAFTTFHGKEIKIWASLPLENKIGRAFPPGYVMNDKESILVNTGSGILKICEASYDQEGIIQTELGRIIKGRGAILGT